MSKQGQERERCPNNQFLVVCKKEGITSNLPHAMKHHVVPLSPLIFHAHISSGFHVKSDLYQPLKLSHKTQV